MTHRFDYSLRLILVCKGQCRLRGCPACDKCTLAPPTPFKCRFPILIQLHLHLAYLASEQMKWRSDLLLQPTGRGLEAAVLGNGSVHSGHQ